MLRIEGVSAGYGNKAVVADIDATVMAGQILAVIGRNGSGKSTLLKALFGLLPLLAGRVVVDDVCVNGYSPRELIKLGIIYAPQGNRVFSNLDVYDNLRVCRPLLGHKRFEAGLQRALDMFPQLIPVLRSRAGQLSGGERQMLALARTVLFSPKLLLLDEPSIGLSPQLVEMLFLYVKNIGDRLGSGVVLVEQKVGQVLSIADMVLVLRNGRRSFWGPPSEIRDSEVFRSVFL